MPKNIYTVYKLTCQSTGKSYVGFTSKSLDKRWKSHRAAMTSNPHHPLYKDMKQYDDWIKEELFIGFEKKYTKLVETSFIQSLDTVNNGYNMIYR